MPKDFVDGTWGVITWSWLFEGDRPQTRAGTLHVDGTNLTQDSINVYDSHLSWRVRVVIENDVFLQIVYDQVTDLASLERCELLVTNAVDLGLSLEEFRRRDLTHFSQLLGNGELELSWSKCEDGLVVLSDVTFLNEIQIPIYRLNDSNFDEQPKSIFTVHGNSFIRHLRKD